MGPLSKNGLGDRPHFPDKGSEQRQVVELRAELSVQFPAQEEKKNTRKVSTMPRKDQTPSVKTTEHSTQWCVLTLQNTS